MPRFTILRYRILGFMILGFKTLVLGILGFKDTGILDYQGLRILGFRILHGVQVSNFIKNEFSILSFFAEYSGCWNSNKRIRKRIPKILRFSMPGIWNTGIQNTEIHYSEIHTGY